MIRIFKKQPLKVPQQKEKNIIEEKKLLLGTILELLKSGNEIGLKIVNRDNSDAMSRILDFDNVRITISEWSEWTITIQLYKDDKYLTVYKSPGLKVDWYYNKIEWANRSSKPLVVEWAIKGEWCNYIIDRVDEFKEKLDIKRKKEQLRKVEEENRKKAEKETEISKLSSQFNEFFKNKN